MAERRDPLDALQHGLAELDAAGLRRRRRIVTTPCRPEAGLADRSAPVLAFCSNDYLGLAAEPALAWLKADNAALGGITPLSLLDTDIGAHQVAEVLVRLDHGIFS